MVKHNVGIADLRPHEVLPPHNLLTVPRYYRSLAGPRRPSSRRVWVPDGEGRRRDVPYGTPPPRIPAYGAAIPGSCLRSERQVAVASLTERGDRFGLVVASAE